MIADDPVDIGILHIGERHIIHIISLQKTEPRVIVLKIKRFPHPFRHLVDEAENTTVAAVAVIIHERALELYSEIFPGLFLDLKQRLLPVFLPDQHIDLFVIHEIPIVKDIFDRCPVHGNEVHARQNTHLPGYTAILNIFNSVSFPPHDIPLKNDHRCFRSVSRIVRSVLRTLSGIGDIYGILVNLPSEPIFVNLFSSLFTGSIYVINLRRYAYSGKIRQTGSSLHSMLHIPGLPLGPHFSRRMFHGNDR